MAAAPPRPRFRLKASSVGGFFHHTCARRFVTDAAGAGTAGADADAAGADAAPVAYRDLIFARGYRWEAALVEQLRASVGVPTRRVQLHDAALAGGAVMPPADVAALLARIRPCAGAVVVVYHLRAATPSAGVFAGAAAAAERAGVTLAWGSFEPDFIVFDGACLVDAADGGGRGADGGRVTVTVVDAKSSAHLRLAYQVQVAYYVAALAVLLEGGAAGGGGPFDLAPLGVVWRPRGDGDSEYAPPTAGAPQLARRLALVGVAEDAFPLELVAPLLDTFATASAVTMLAAPAPAWHFNAGCVSCARHDACRSEALARGTLSVIPGVSSADYRWLRAHLDNRGGAAGGAAAAAADIEELGALAGAVLGGGAAVDAAWGHTSQQRLRRLLAWDDTRRDSPVLRAARAAVAAAREAPPTAAAAARVVAEPVTTVCLDLPATEDTAIAVSLLVDVRTQLPCAWALVARGAAAAAASGVAHVSADAGGDDDDDDAAPAGAAAPPVAPPAADGGGEPPTEPFPCARLLTALAAVVRDAAGPRRRATGVQVYVTDHAERGALQRLLLTAVTAPLPPALADDLRVCLRALVDGPAGVAADDPPLDGAATVAHVPRVIGVVPALTALFAVSVPGYVTGGDLARALAPSPAAAAAAAAATPPGGAAAAARGGSAWHSDATLLQRFISAGGAAAAAMLQQRAAACLELLDAGRAAYQRHTGDGAAWAAALPWPVADIDLTPTQLVHPQLRRLTYIAQLEASTALGDLQRGRALGTTVTTLRIDACTRDGGVTATVLSPAPAAPVEASSTFPQWLLQPAGGGAYSDVQYARNTWIKTSNFVFCSVVAPPDGAGRPLRLQLTDSNPRWWLAVGSEVRLSPRGMDFLTPMLTQHFDRLDDVVRRGKPAPPAGALLTTGAFLREAAPPPSNYDAPAAAVATALQRLAGVVARPPGGTGGAAVPRLNAAQSRAFEAVVAQRFTVVWGPPGTGKTYTLSHIALLLSAAVYTATGGGARSRCRVLVTASTHSAVDNLLRCMQGLLEELRRYPELTTWASDVDVVKMAKPTTRATPRGGGGGGGGDAGGDGGDGGEAGGGAAGGGGDGDHDGADFAAGDAPPAVRTVASLRGTKRSAFAVAGATVWEARKQWLKTTETPGPQAQFDLIIIDEGSQVPVGHALLPISCLAPGARLVVVGDPQQLGPISRVVYPAADAALPLHASILDLLIRHADGVRGMVVQLGENHRMGYQLTHHSARYVYGPTFTAAADREPLPLRSDLPPLHASPMMHTLRAALVRVATTAAAGTLPSMVSIVLSAASATPGASAAAAVLATPYEAQVAREAEVVAGLITRLRADVGWPRGATADSDLFVVAPHRVQRDAISAELRRIIDAAPPGVFPGGPPPVAIADTVEKRQGQEADAVVVAYGYFDDDRVASEAAFLYNLNRINVAVTRARRLCVLVVSDVVLGDGGSGSAGASGTGAVPAAMAAALASPATRSALLYLRAFVRASVRIDITIPFAPGGAGGGAAGGGAGGGGHGRGGAVGGAAGGAAGGSPLRS